MTTRFHLTESPAWRHWVTPKLARENGIHRWYLFPHSFTGQFVHALIREWALEAHDRILDPFVGSGTTLLAAKEKRVPATGYDLSPLAVLASTTKVAALSRSALEHTWDALHAQLDGEHRTSRTKSYPELVRSALPHGRLEALDAVASRIDALDCTSAERGFFRLALLSIIPRFSKAVANGGWLRWSDVGAEATLVVKSFRERVESMLLDVHGDAPDCVADWTAEIADARALPDCDSTYSAVITSPPYPNRHDYTRVFGVELMFEFSRLGEESRASIPEHSIRTPRRGPDVRPFAAMRRPNGWKQTSSISTSRGSGGCCAGISWTCTCACAKSGG